MKRLFLLLRACMITVSTLLAQSTVERKTIVYSAKDGVQLQLDKYVDNSVLYKGKRPVIIYVHGGGFATGSRVNALQIQYCKHFTSQGFVAITIDYRLGLTNNNKPDEGTIMKAVSV